MQRAQLVVNPRAGKGAIERAWERIERALDAGGLEYRATFTDRGGHAEEIARMAVEDGYRYVVAVGGDGTVNEVVNGLMGNEAALAPGIVLGVLPSGTGCDFAKTFGIPQDPLDAVRHLLGEGTWGTLDVGRMRYRAPSGDEGVRWFLNIAEAGIGAHVVSTASRMPSWLGPAAYRVAAVKGIASFTPQRARIELHGRAARGVKRETPLSDLVHEGDVTMVVVANCQFFGGGLRVAPRAIPSDGMLDVVIGEGSKWDAVRALKKMPAGLHVPHPTLKEFLADRVVIDGPEPLAVEADGEPLGTTPATFDVVRDAIALKI